MIRRLKSRVLTIQSKKREGKKIIALTAYDFPSAAILEKADIDMIILGDSVGTNVLGYRDETAVKLTDIIHHGKAVRRGTRRLFLTMDLPFGTYEDSVAAVKNAKKLQAIGADAIKFEGPDTRILTALKRQNLTVMCHLGLNPQHDQRRIKLGKISRGKRALEAIDLIRTARVLQDSGADFILLEKIPEKVSKIITDNLRIPTIGIGAGKYCDGQVLVLHDLFGINERKYMHCPEYINLRKTMIETIQKYSKATITGSFPASRHTNKIADSEFDQVADWCLSENLKI